MTLDEFLQALPAELAFVLRTVTAGHTPAGRGRLTCGPVAFELHQWRVIVQLVTVEWGKPSPGDMTLHVEGERTSKGGVS